MRGAEAINVHSISLACWIKKLFDLTVNIVKYCSTIIVESYGWISMGNEKGSKTINSLLVVALNKLIFVASEFNLIIDR